MYEYLIGTVLIVGGAWLLAFLLRKDLRLPMLWSGWAYAAVLSIGFVLLKVLALFIKTSPELTITPGYWEPQTIFNLGELTGGYALEDFLFIFFAGGLAAAVYEIFFRRGIKTTHTNHYHLRAIFIGSLAAGLFVLLIPLNWIYALIVFGVFGSLDVWRERPDLIQHSLWGGIFMVLIYFGSFLLFELIFPGAYLSFFNLQNISGRLILGIPLEELLFALSFGLLWAPLYEYEHGIKA